MKPTRTDILDTNIILRFLREDHPEHFRRAKKLFRQAEKGVLNCYIDSVILAEAVWTLSSYYKTNRTDIATKFEMLLVQSWMVSEQKQVLLSAIHAYQATTMDYIDCWLLALSEEKNIFLVTFDAKLKKYQKKIHLV